MGNKLDSIKILITGDMCPINRIQNLVLDGKFDEIYNDFSPHLSGNDLNISNLECPLSNHPSPINKLGPNLIAKEECIKLLKYGKFDLVTLSNNHIMDHGKSGLLSTIRLCKENKIDWVGAGCDVEQASKIWYKEIKGKKIAILNFSEIEFSSAENSKAGSNSLVPVRNFYSIKYASENADYVIVIVHGGHERYQLPSPRMVETYRFFIDAGAHLVVGHHTHCFSGYEKYKRKYIYYSLGNFIFDIESKIDMSWNFGYVVKLILNDSNILTEIVPYKQCNGIPGIFLLDEQETKRFENEIEDLNKVIGVKELLQLKWKEFVDEKKIEYLIRFEGVNSRIYRALRQRRFLPSFLSRKRKRQLYNLLQCDAHRDISIESLK